MMNRRDFLKAGAALAGVAALPAVASPVSSGMAMAETVDVPWQMVTVTVRGGCLRVCEGWTLPLGIQEFVREMMKEGMIEGFCFHSLPFDCRDDVCRQLGIPDVDSEIRKLKRGSA